VRALQPAVWDVTALLPAAAHEELARLGLPDAEEGQPWAARRAGVAARLAGAAAQQREVRDAAAVVPLSAQLRAVLPRVVPRAAGRPSAARPLAEPWAFHQDRPRLAPARRRAAQFARAKARQRIASPSKPLWPAARDEVLSS
jgi:hypothetical protein